MLFYWLLSWTGNIQQRQRRPQIATRVLQNATRRALRVLSLYVASHITNVHNSLDDLAEAMPAVAKGLQTLLTFDGDVQAVYSRQFEARHSRQWD